MKPVEAKCRGTEVAGEFRAGPGDWVVQTSRGQFGVKCQRATGLVLLGVFERGGLQYASIARIGDDEHSRFVAAMSEAMAS